MKAVLMALTLMTPVCSQADTGPRLTDAEFFAMLDPGRPELAKTIEAAKAGNYAAATHEFAEYLRARTKPVHWVNPHARPKHKTRPEGVDTEGADRILQRDLPSVGVYHKFDGEIDWNLNPINYKEWPWQLNRHPFWVWLGRAYWATGEEKYAREFVYQMTDWIKKNPIPVGASGNATYTWRTIEQGIRCANAWPESFYLFLTSPSFTDDAMVTMVKSFVEHARQLMTYKTGANWLTMEADGLMHVGVLFPEFTEAAEWRKTASSRLFEELDRQVYPDGAQIELTTGYHQVSLSNFVKAFEIARINDIPMPEGYIPKLEKMYHYNLAASMPDGRLPGLNDAWHTNIRGQLKRGFEFFPNRTDFQWIATSGKEGEKSALGSVGLPFAGQLVMRTGWDPQDLYLLMDAGPFGAGHQHEDALSIVIYSHGKYHLVDTGIYAYNDSQWRQYVLDTRGHNTIMVDGQEQHRRGCPRELLVVTRPYPNKWATSDTFDYASGVYDYGYGDRNEVRVTHTRHIFFVKPDYWIVTDLMTPPDDEAHRYESIFHLDADAAQVDEKSKSVRTVNKSGSNLAIIPLADEGLDVKLISGQEEPVVQGWMPVGGTSSYDVRPIPTPIFEKASAGPTWLAYAFYPTPEEASCPVDGIDSLDVEAEQGVQAVGLVVRFADGRRDYFVQAEKRTKLKFADFETDSLGAYVRTSRGAVISAVALDGTGMTQSGKQIKTQVLPVQDLSRTTVRHKF